MSLSGEDEMYYQGRRDGSAEAADRMRALEAALQPFARLADEIEFCAGPNGNPDNWSMACTWLDLVAARKALRNSTAST